MHDLVSDLRNGQISLKKPFISNPKYQFLQKNERKPFQLGFDYSIRIRLDKLNSNELKKKSFEEKVFNDSI
jgi:hypothetical protein